MKKRLIIILILLIIPISLFSQIDESEPRFDTKKDFISFFLAEKKPMFENCKEINDEDLKKCFHKNLEHHITKNLVYPEKYINDSIEVRIFTNFKINKEGKVFDVKTRMGKIKDGKSIICEDRKLFIQESIRIIESLPRMKPAEYNGEKVNILYCTIINFSLKKN